MTWYKRCAAGLAAMTLILAGCGSSREQQPELAGEPIRIGVATSLSGGSAMVGEGSKRGAEMAVADYNQAGGYKGRPVKLVIYDDEANADRSVEVVTRLIKQDKVVAVIGGANSGNVTKHMGILQESGVPEVVPVATATTLTQGAPGKKNHVFRVSMVDSGQVATMLKFAVDQKGFKKLAILHDATAYGTSGRDDILKQLESRGLKPVAVQAFSIGQVDMRKELQVIQDAGAEVILSYALGPEVAAIIRSMNGMSLQIPLVGAWMVGDPSVKKAVGPMVNSNVYTIQSYTVDSSEEARAFHEKVVRRYGEDIFPIATAQGYDAARMVLAALDKVGPDSGALRDALENLEGFKGVTAAPARPFSAQNHDAITSASMFVATYKNGVLVKVQ